MAYTTQQLIDMSLTVYDLRTAMQKFYAEYQGLDTNQGSGGTDITSTDELSEGTKNLYFTAQRVRNTEMQGIVFTSTAAVMASDTVLTSIGKLQAQASSYGDVVTYSIGTSGEAVPLLNTANTWSMPQTFSGGMVGNASTASAWKTARTLSAKGDATWSISVDGSANVSANLTLANSGVTAGTYPKVTVDAKGRVTAGAALLASDVPILNQSTTGNAATATKLKTAIEIKLTGFATGSGSFDGSNNLSIVTTGSISNATESTAGIARIATTKQAQALTDNTTIMTPAKIPVAFNAAGAAPLYACRAWVNFNAVPLNGTYSQSGTTVTVTMTAHGMSVGQNVNLSITSGTGVSGSYPVATVIDANTFTYTASTSLTTSGNVTRNNFIRASGNVLGITDNGVGDYTVNFITPMPDLNYSLVGTCKSDYSDIQFSGCIDIYSVGTTTAQRIRTKVNGGNGVFFDSSLVNISVFR